MDEKNYLIQFDYAGETHSIHNLSHHDFSNGNIGDKHWMALGIEDYLRSNKIHEEGAKVTNARLFGKGGELIVKIEDFGEEFRI